MMTVIDQITNAIHKAFNWISSDQECYLVVDNVGEHGTKQAIDEYTNLLYTKLKTTII